jgi:hypothetical protein
VAGDGGAEAAAHPGHAEEARPGSHALSARDLVLVADDLPGRGWDASDVPDPDHLHGPGGGPLDACLTGFPDEAVLEAAESARFTRGDELAWSVAWCLSSEDAAAAAAARLAEESFALCLLSGLGLAEQVLPPAAVPGGVAHLAVVTAGDEEGVATIYVALLALGVGSAAVLAVLASTEPVPGDELVLVSSRLERRMRSSG